MEIKGAEKLLGQDKKISFEKILQAAGGSLDILTRGLIVTLSQTDPEKAKQLKKDYFEQIIGTSTEKKMAKMTKEEIKRVKNFKDLDIEIIQEELRLINKKLEELK